MKKYQYKSRKEKEYDEKIAKIAATINTTKVMSLSAEDIIYKYKHTVRKHPDGGNINVYEGIYKEQNQNSK